ncbi:hypothetical protein [Crocosphaera sp.]|uniref:hypothetical protein n=1 Tax=Crocosphaera sp. TaxID=2729996 RepID=UPI00260FA509|nr:hypothetical protein [Crocosphaera sp.]MDJ0579208.1 hypothetical protein [Crocosphaera sp.]
MSGKKSYSIEPLQERIRQRLEASKKREEAIIKKIAEVRARIRANSSQIKPSPISSPNNPIKVLQQQQNDIDQNSERKIMQLKTRLPKIQAEYQSLVEQNVLEQETVTKLFQDVQKAINEKQPEKAEDNLRTLDNFRIQAIQYLQNEWLEQIQYCQDRLDNVIERLPDTCISQLQHNLEQMKNNWKELNESNILEFHQQLNELEEQAEQVQEMADHLVQSWQEVGYEQPQILGIDDGNIVLEVETHEGVNTQMRVQFSGEQLDLFGPPEETPSCAARTQDVLAIFQKQGYQLEWTTLDGQPVPKEWRQIHTVNSESETIQNPSESQTNKNKNDAGFSSRKKSQNRRQGQTY